MELGINVARDGSSPMEGVTDLRATLARFVGMQDHDLSGYVHDLARQGIATILVLARESFEGFGPLHDNGLPQADTARAAFRHYRELYGDRVFAFQVGNEPDHESPSSWTLPQDDLSWLVNVARYVMPEELLILGGLVSGQPSWLESMDLTHVNAVAVHPYGKPAPDGANAYNQPISIEDLLGYYADATGGKDLIVTENGPNYGADFQGREYLADNYSRDLFQWAARTTRVGGQKHDSRVLGYIHFCYSDSMVNGFGIVERPNERQAFRQASLIAVDHIDVAPPEDKPSTPPPVVVTPEPEPAMAPMTTDDAETLDLCYGDIFLAPQRQIKGIAYSPELGIVKLWKDNMGRLGSAVGPERVSTSGAVYQAFALGIVRWSADTGAVIL